MNIYLIERKDKSTTKYDVYYGFVIAAPTPTQAVNLVKDKITDWKGINIEKQGKYTRSQSKKPIIILEDFNSI